MTEIYAPTTTAQNNLSFLKSLSSSSVWANAPASIRSPASATPRYQAPTHGLPRPPASVAPASRIPPVLSTKATKQNPSGSAKRNHDSFKGILTPDSQVQPSGDETTTSLTHTIGTQQDRFQELEAAIRNQNSSIKAHQTEFAAVHKRFDGLEGRVLNHQKEGFGEETIFN
jgi:uncharacterized coiled-coil protein SlyX